MKILEKISLTLFSVIMLLLSIILIVILFGWLNDTAINLAIGLLRNSPVATNITIGACVVIILLSIKSIFFSSDFIESASNEGIKVTSENGSVLITRETLENIVNGVVKNFDGAKETSCRINIDKENNLTIDLNVIVQPDVVIKDLSSNIQNKIKETIKATSDLEVKEINIKIKNVYAKKTEEV